MRYELITILGPTATGKTKLAVQLANEFNGEIISADSRQVYKGMNIGTGKDLSDYNIKRKIIPHHLIDIIEPTEEFDVFKFQNLFNKTFEEIKAKNKTPFLVGGTGMYLSSVLQNYNLAKADFQRETENLFALSEIELKKMLSEINPNLHNTTDLTNKERIIKAIAVNKAKQSVNENKIIKSFNIGIKLNREEIKKRITARLKIRLEKEGMIEEVKTLMNSGIGHEKMLYFGLEYKFIAMYIKGELNYNDMFQKLNSAIHSFAKRQMTWFRKMEKEGVVICWIDGPDFNQAKELIEMSLMI